MEWDNADTVPVSPGRGGPLPDGSVVADRYRLHSVLGEGGMGVVYRAEDLHLDDWVALKALHSKVGREPKILERFKREVKLARRVTHESVARVYELGLDGELHFLTMEMIDGPSLNRWMTGRGPLDAVTAAPIVRGIAAGLDAAHAAGVVHRDIKPDNVMLDRERGRVVITDFGIARNLATELSETVDVIGTPAYMAPEQIEGGEITARTDIYAFGILIFHLLTGRLPFEGKTPFALAFARLSAPPPDPRMFVPQLDEQVAVLVLECLSKNPEHRPASAGEVAAAFAGASKIELRTPLARRPTQRLRVAVLPFASEPGDAHVSAAVTEDLIDALGQMRSLRVLTRRMTEGLADRAPPEVGRELAVDRIVEGSVRKNRELYRIVARVIDSANGEQILTQRADVARDGLMSVGDRLATHLADAMNAAPLPAGTTPELSGDLVELYLEARQHLRGTAPDPAITLLSQAEAKIPRHPLILSGLVMARLRQIYFSWKPDPSTLGWALETAQRAVKEGPDLSEPRVALAMARLHSADAVGAVVALREAIARSPSNAEALAVLGEILFEIGRVPEGVRRMELALELDSTLTNSWWGLARHRFLEGDFEAAEGHMRRVLRQLRDARLASLFARFALWKRDLHEFQRLLDVVVSQGADETIFTNFPIGVAVGRVPVEEAFAKIDEALSRPGTSWRTRSVGHCVRAELAGFLGRPELLLAGLRVAAEDKLHDIVWLDGCPLLEEARSMPSFAEIRAQVSASAEAVIDAVW